MVDELFKSFSVHRTGEREYFLSLVLDTTGIKFLLRYINPDKKLMAYLPKEYLAFIGEFVHTCHCK
jgi:hypothetical protein